MDSECNPPVTMSDPETSGQFVTRDEFSRHEARLDSRFDEILQLIGKQKTRIQDGATGLDKGEIATLKAEIGMLKQEKEKQRNLLEGEIANLKAEIGKHKQEKERERNLLLSQSLEHEKARADMEALRKEMVMTTELESAKKQQKTLQQEKEELIAEIASLKNRLQQENSVDEIAVIRAQLEETQKRLSHLEAELKKAALEESKVREKHEEKIAALDNHLKSLLTNQVHQHLVREERTDVHSPSCSVYDEERLKKIRTVFVQHINPLNVLHFFHKFNTRMLTQHDIEKVTAATKNHGKFVGAAELLSCLVRYKDWFPCLLQVLREPLVKQEHVANRMEEILEQDPVVDADINNLMDEDNVEEHHGTECQEISRLHRHMEVLEMALTTCHNEISQANTDKNEVRDKLDKLKNHIQKLETSHSHELDQKEERLASLEKLTQQTQCNMTKEFKDLQKTFKDNIKKTMQELDTKIDSIDKEFQQTQEQNMATIKEQASKWGKVEKKLEKMMEEEQERWSQIDSIHTDVESLKDDQGDTQQLVKLKGLEKHMGTLTCQCDFLQDQVEIIEISTQATNGQVQKFIQTTTATSRSMEELTSRVEDTERSVRGCVAQRERDENRRKEMEDRVAVLETRRQQDLDHYTKELEETNSLLHDVVKTVEDISTQLDKHERSVVPARVGFTAYNRYGSLPRDGSPITNFTTVLCNEGNHYNTSSGEFICPVDGLYVVSTTLRQIRDGEVDVRIKRHCSDTATPSTEVCKARTNLDKTSCCGVAVVRLTHRDRVYVEVHRKTGDPGLDGHSSFSCFQIG